MLVGKKFKYELLYYIHIPTNRLNSKAKLLEGNWLVFVNYNDYKNNIHVSLPYLFSFLKLLTNDTNITVEYRCKNNHCTYDKNVYFMFLSLYYTTSICYIENAIV